MEIQTSKTLQLLLITNSTYVRDAPSLFGGVREMGCLSIHLHSLRRRAEATEISTLQCVFNHVDYCLASHMGRKPMHPPTLPRPNSGAIERPSSLAIYDRKGKKKFSPPKEHSLITSTLAKILSVSKRK